VKRLGVGTAVCATVCATVGPAVRAAVCATVGPAVRATVGPAVRATVGTAICATVGTAVRATVMAAGDSFSPSVGRTLEIVDAGHAWFGCLAHLDTSLCRYAGLVQAGSRPRAGDTN
jgi:hypothetical protein